MAAPDLYGVSRSQGMSSNETGLMQGTQSDRRCALAPRDRCCRSERVEFGGRQLEPDRAPSAYGH